MNDLQKEWDKFLVQSFYRFPHANANNALHTFMAQNNSCYEEVNKLKRVPKSYHHQRVTVSRFVCAFLPKIAKVLWEHNIEQLDKLAAAVSKLNSDAREVAVDEGNRVQDRNEIVRSKYEMKRFKQKSDAIENLYSKHRKNDQWGVVK